MNSYLAPVRHWYAQNARDLPWRRPGTSAWSVLVSEFMLQQTPVSRVLPAHAAWLARWPEAADLAAASPADAVRQWGRLGYPRRAVRLHASAQLIVSRHDGRVPESADDLKALPGVGEYTAAAVASFAYAQRHAVLDVNVRRVLARLVGGTSQPAAAASVAERRLAGSLLPADGKDAARWSVAVMELGALVCTSARPRCGQCPVAALCAWRQRGLAPDQAGVRKTAGGRTARYQGSDRQCRGSLLDVLRQASGPVRPEALAAAWHDEGQRARSLAALIVDGLVTSSAHGTYALPGDEAPA